MSKTLDACRRLGGKAEIFHGGGAEVSSADFASLRAPLQDAERTGTTLRYVVFALFCYFTWAEQSVGYISAAATQIDST